MTNGEPRETFLSGDTVFSGRIIQVEKWRVLLPDGRQADREIVLHNGAAAIVPVDSRGRVTLVRQHRVAVGLHTWEIPAGKLDRPDEDPLSCAKRELEEETGLRAASWRLMVNAISSPGFCTESIALYLATDLTRHEAHTDPDEFLRVTALPLEEAVDLAMAGEFRDAKTCLGLLMAYRMLSRERLMPLRDGLGNLAHAARAPLSRLGE